MTQELILHIVCKQGYIEITAQGMLQVRGAIRGVLWSIPASTITQITNPKRGHLGVSIGFYSQLGSYQVDGVSHGNFAKLQAAIAPYLTSQQPPMPPR